MATGIDRASVLWWGVLLTGVIAERPEKAARISRMPKGYAECNAASQDAHRMQMGYRNARTVEPALYFSEMVSDREIAGPSNLDGLH
jgi:hypothetical protein